MEEGGPPHPPPPWNVERTLPAYVGERDISHGGNRVWAGEISRTTEPWPGFGAPYPAQDGALVAHIASGIGWSRDILEQDEERQPPEGGVANPARA